MPINSFLYPSKNVPVPYEVNNSCRFNDGDSPSLSKTMVAGSTDFAKKFTISVWFKLGAISGARPICSFGSGTTDAIDLLIDNNSKAVFESWDGSVNPKLTTNRVLKDYGAWYNIVVAVDTTQATDTNRMKMYINGVQETSFASSVYAAEDYLFPGIGTTNDTMKIGSGGQYNSNYFDGYMAEFVYCDGQVLSPTDFGEFDEDSPTIWKPKDVSGLTFGNAGTYCDFQDSGNLGDDESGNTNDLTENNIVAADQATDTPTNNFCTMNPLDYTPTTFAEGNLKLNFSQSPNVFGITTGTLFMGSGKYYFEAKITSPDSSTGIQVGVIQVEPYLSRLTAPGVDLSLFFGLGARFITTGGVHKVLNGTDSSISDTWSNDVIIRIAYDGSAGKIYMWTGTSELTGQDISAGTSFNSGTLTSGTMVLPYLSLGDGGSGTKTCQIEFNFGGCPAFSISSGNSDANGYGNFEYSVPSGYYSLCTKNLAEFG